MHFYNYYLIGKSAYGAPFTFDCKFPINVSMKNSEFSKDNIQIKKEIFELMILVNDKGAFIIGNQGIGKLDVIPHRTSAYTFLEITPMNTVQVIVIDNKLNAVYSRHTQLLGSDNKLELSPSQYYDKFEIRN